MRRVSVVVAENDDLQLQVQLQVNSKRNRLMRDEVEKHIDQYSNIVVEALLKYFSARRMKVK